MEGKRSEGETKDRRTERRVSNSEEWHGNKEEEVRQGQLEWGTNLFGPLERVKLGNNHGETTGSVKVKGEGACTAKEERWKGTGKEGERKVGTLGREGEGWPTAFQNAAA